MLTVIVLSGPFTSVFVIPVSANIPLFLVVPPIVISVPVVFTLPAFAYKALLLFPAVILNTESVSSTFALPESA